MFDHKQITIINTWFDMAKKYESKEEYYTAFIALWISFNAFCYAKFAVEANGLRSDLKDKDNAKKYINSKYCDVVGSIVGDGEQIRLKIIQPIALSLSIKEKYTEDLIFSKFAKTYQNLYLELLENLDFKSVVSSLRESLKKQNGYYVLNMLKAVSGTDKMPISQLKNEGRAVLFYKIESLMELTKVLYQIRCNVFHGEKIPGNLNDDQILKTAFPALFCLMQAIRKGEGF